MIALGAALATPSASAFPGGASAVIFRAEASNVIGDAVVEVGLDEGVWAPNGLTYTYIRSDPLEFVSEATGEVVGTLLDIYVFLRVSPVAEIQVGFSVLAGPERTTFLVDSPLLDFASVPQAEARGRASASITAADLTQDFARVETIGTPGSGCYEAWVYPPSGARTRFSSLLSFVQAGANSTVSGSQNDPPTGYRAIGQTVDATGCHVAFSLTEMDYASVTSRFVVPPRSSVCPGDIDADQLVSLSDLTLMLGAFGTVDGDPHYDIDCDLDPDDSITLTDLTTLLASFGAFCP